MVAWRDVPTHRRVLGADDPAVHAFTRVRERDLVGREGLFLAEGEVVLRVLAGQSRYAVRALLLAENRVEKVADVLAGLPREVEVLVAPQALMSAICGFDIHRGVLALGVRGALPTAARALAELPPGCGATVVALAGIANHDNVGGVFRNAAAFGADLVLLDEASCDPLYRKAIRVSAGGALTVPFARAPSAGAMVGLLAQAGFDLVLLSPGGARDIGEAARRAGRRRAIVLGAEGPGLPAELLASHGGTRIEISPDFDSLNVAVASGIALFALSR